MSETVPGIIDSHLHQWHPRRTPWASSRFSRAYRVLPGLGERLFPVVVPRSTRQYVLTPSTVGRAYETRDYVRDAAALAVVDDIPGLTGPPRVESVVLVSSQWDDSSASRWVRVRPEVATEAEDAHLDEVRYFLSLPYGAGTSPDLGAIVVTGDPRSQRLGAQLDAQRALTDKVRGVRYIATRHSDSGVRNGGDTDGVLTSETFLRGVEQIAARGLTLELAVYAHQIYDVVAVAETYPHLAVVVENLGTPVGIFGPVGNRTGATAAARADIARLWRERITSLAVHRNIVVKLSGVAMPILGYGQQRSGNIGGRDTLVEMMGPQIRHLISTLGPDRVMFGSNYPLDRPNAPLDMVVEAIADVLEPYGSGLTRKVFRDNAARIYRIDG